MHKLILTLIASAFAITPAAFAADSADIASDKAAIVKDEKAIQKHEKNLKKHRAEKADAKARGDKGDQAAASVKIGADHTAIGAKKAEKKVDEEILEHNQNN